MSRQLVIANDHAGTALKLELLPFLQALDLYDVVNLGTDETSSVDYPRWAHQLGRFIDQGEAEVGILICGSGNGVAMTANKYSRVRAAICWTQEIAYLARAHNDANVLCLPARFLEKKESFSITQTFLSTPFEGGRHQNRVAKIPPK